jgi:hypothetical protein
MWVNLFLALAVFDVLAVTPAVVLLAVDVIRYL